MMNKIDRKTKNGKPTAISYKLKANQGFTLIELLVSSAIFIVVMVISIGAVLSIVDANRKAQSLNSVITNLNFAVESMVRDLREGTNYVASECDPACHSITLNDSHGQLVTYSLEQDSVTGAGSIRKTTPTFTSSITASEVNIKSMNFYVNGNLLGDGQQPTILFVINGIAGNNLKTQSGYKLETLVTQRILDS